jgi:ABC-type Fe3+ transport system permease subunit
MPQISPGLIAGVMLVFLPATGQFVIPDLLGGAGLVMLGNAIQQQFGQSRDWPFGATIAFVALGLVIAGSLDLFTKGWKRKGDYLWGAPSYSLSWSALFALRLYLCAHHCGHRLFVQRGALRRGLVGIHNEMV